MSITLLLGVELGVTAGVAISILIHLYKTSRPHIAIVGRVPGTEHYRNVLRHDVLIDPAILTIRVDESLYFANTRFLEDRIYDEVAKQPALKHVVLMCSAVNTIDMSALESLEAINERLDVGGVTLHFSEVKGPVMDQLNATGFLEILSGEIFLSQHLAQTALRSKAEP
jgi:SulP family sulfate permease